MSSAIARRQAWVDTDGRTDFNGRSWPHDSPVARSYDVQNSSTKMIILNNRYGKNSTRLRGYYTGPKRYERFVNPDRHRAKSPRNPEFHVSCFDSSSPTFEPTVKTDLEWVNSSQRPPNSLIGYSMYGARTSRSSSRLSLDLSSLTGEQHRGYKQPYSARAPLHKVTSSVNPHRHTSCGSHPNMPVGDGRPMSCRSSLPSKYMNSTEYSDMSIGERIYMWSIERIYSVDKMKQLKQDQYKKLLEMEAKKGKYGSQEYAKYMRYINNAKDRTYGTGTPQDRSKSMASFRSRSAMSRSSVAKSDRSETDRSLERERPKTSTGATNRDKSATKPPGSATSDQRPVTSQQKSRSPARTATRPTKSAYSTRSTNSAKSNASKSKASSRASSAASAKFAYGGGVEQDVTPRHKEGKDRPKSRLGHPHADDKDKDSIASTVSSIKSNITLSSDSGVGNGRKEGKKTNEAKDEIDAPRINKPKDNKAATSKDKKMGSKASISSKGSIKSSSTARSASSSGKMGSRASMSSKASSKSKDSVISSKSTTSTIKSENSVRRNEQDKDRGSTASIDQNQNDDVKKIHRVPSEGYIEGDKGMAVAKADEEPDNKGLSDPEAKKHDSSDDESKVKVTETSSESIGNTKGGDSDDKVETNNTNNTQNSEAKKAETQADDNVEKRDDDLVDIDEVADANRRETDTENQTDEAKANNDDTGRVRNKLNRQESIDESDNDNNETTRDRKDPDKLEY